MKDTDKSLLFLIISCGCFWLVLDQLYGKQLIAQFILAIIPGAKQKYGSVGEWLSGVTSNLIEDTPDEQKDELKKVFGNDFYESDKISQTVRTNVLQYAYTYLQGNTEKNLAKSRISQNNLLSSTEKDETIKMLEKFWTYKEGKK